jgi:hypothetical protein
MKRKWRGEVICFHSSLQKNSIRAVFPTLHRSSDPFDDACVLREDSPLQDIHEMFHQLLVAPGTIIHETPGGMYGTL